MAREETLMANPSGYTSLQKGNVSQLASDLNSSSGDTYLISF